ncbi:uncharacterized protein LOC144751888 [Ciona intestinalis]
MFNALVSALEVPLDINSQCFSSSGWPTGYANDVSSLWTIHNNDSYKIELTISSLDTEMYYDTVQVKDKYETLAMYSGNIAENQTIFSNIGQPLAVLFESDSTTTSAGFQFCVKAVPASNIAQVGLKVFESASLEISSLMFWNDSVCGDHDMQYCDENIYFQDSTSVSSKAMYNAVYRFEIYDALFVHWHGYQHFTFTSVAEYPFVGLMWINGSADSYTLQTWNATEGVLDVVLTNGTQNSTAHLTNSPKNVIFGYMLLSKESGDIFSVTEIKSCLDYIAYALNKAVDCPSECEGCIGPCRANSFGGCNCSCIAGYFPAQFICQPVLCMEDTLVHPTLLINVTFPTTQAGFKDSSVEKCSDQTVNGGKPYGTRNCLLNGTSTTPLWLSSCNTGLEVKIAMKLFSSLLYSLANIIINSTNERVSVANDLEILTSDPVSITSDDIINSVEVINNVLDTPTVTPEVSSSVLNTVSNLVDVPAEELAVSGEADSLLMTLDTVGEKVELDENGVYEDVTSNVGMTVLLPFNSKKLRSGGKLRGAVLLINLSVALLLLNLLLIFSEQEFVYSSSDSCLAVGVLLHFSLLASFGWMMVEAANLYLVIVKPMFNRSRVTNRNVFILSNIWGWFVPSLFVGVTCAVDLFIYQRSDKECWMKTNMVSYLVDIPLIIMFIFNLVTYVSVLVASASSQSIRKVTTEIKKNRTRISNVGKGER